MGRICTFVAVLTIVLATSAHAGTSPPGLNLRWDQCYGDGGVQYRNFACDTNTGNERLIATFELAAAPAVPVSGLEVYVNIASLGPLPAWWGFKNPGTCRQASLTMNTVLPATAVNCVDWAAGVAVGGIGAYTIGDTGPNTVYLKMAIAVPGTSLATLGAGQEYYAFTLSINHAKTVGTGSCGGCFTPVVVYLSAIKVTTQTPANDFLLTYGANWSGSQWVSWQQGYPVNVVRGCGMHFIGCAFPYVHFDTVTYSVTGSTNRTWGAVKSL